MSHLDRYEAHSDRLNLLSSKSCISSSTGPIFKIQKLTESAFTQLGGWLSLGTRPGCFLLALASGRMLMLFPVTFFSSVFFFQNECTLNMSGATPVIVLTPTLITMEASLYLLRLIPLGY